MTLQQVLTTEQFTAPGAPRLSYHTTPNRGLPLVSFIHGNGLSAQTYWPLLAPLADEFDLLLIDAQGHGQSEAGQRFLGWQQNANGIYALLLHHLEQRGHGDRECLLGLGHSFGATLTTLIAADHPGLYRQVCLLDPAFFPRSMLQIMAIMEHLRLGSVLPVARKASRRRAHWPSLEAADQWLRPRGVFKHWLPANFDAYLHSALEPAAQGGVQLCCPPWLEARVFATAPLSSWSAVARLPAQSLLLLGEQTDVFFKRAAQTALKLNAGLDLEYLPGDHCFMLQAAQPEVSERLKQYCRQMSRA